MGTAVRSWGASTTNEVSGSVTSSWNWQTIAASLPGRFERLPPGDYRLTLRHGDVVLVQKSVTVTAEHRTDELDVVTAGHWMPRQCV
jgi:hypothetical protein